MTFALFPNAKIGTKLSAYLFVAVGGLFAIFVAVTGSISMQQAEDDAIREVREKSVLLNNTVEVLDRGLRTEVETYAKVFASTLSGEFSVDAARPVAIGDINAPSLLLGDATVNLNFSIPDAFTTLTGAYATIFVRDGDNFIRVTTSHKKEDGTRAVGTKLDPAHPGYALLLKGQPYAGAASLFGGQFMTRYVPIKDKSGEVIGIIYVGVDFTSYMRDLGQGIKALHLGKDGGFYVVSARAGKDRGKALIHRDREGQSLLEDKDISGASIIDIMLTKQQGTLRYTRAASAGKPVRDHVVAFSTIKDWQMLVVGDAYLDDITAGAITRRNRQALIGMLMALGVTALLYLTIRHMVARPIGKALGAVETVATGDLTGEVSVDSGDESGKLMASVKHMKERLASVVTEVRLGTQAIAATSALVSAGNTELSARTTQQAGALEDTASSMEQMNAAVRQNADHALHAQELARDATAKARMGGEAVEQVVDKMGAMSDSARRIADIIGVIDGIAFQTNILALNAAVEAARAGEQGRGFAVVAAEVRTLAQRTSGAAKEIKELINESLEQVASGAALAHRAGGTMHSVVEAIGKVNESIDDMSGATQEQAAGIEQINRAVVQLDELTHHNMALVKEASQAAADLNSRAERLAEVVEFFIVPAQNASESTAPPRKLSALPAKSRPALAAVTAPRSQIAKYKY